MNPKEDKLREAAKKYIKNESHERGHFFGITEKMVVDWIVNFNKSQAAKDYHSKDVEGLEELKDFFNDWHKVKQIDCLENGSEIEACDIFNFFLPYLQTPKESELDELKTELAKYKELHECNTCTIHNLKSKESDAVEFAEWINHNCKCYDSSDMWFYYKDGQNLPYTSKDLYQQFLTSKIK